MKNSALAAKACVLAALFAATGCTKHDATDHGRTAVSESNSLQNGTSTTLAGDAGRGSLLYSKNCATCHGARGEGGVGPILTNEKVKMDTGAIAAWIKSPQPPMPKLYPSPLSEQNVADIAAYVASF